METKLGSLRHADVLPLKPSLVEWKPGNALLGGEAEATLKPSLVEWKRNSLPGNRLHSFP